MTTATQLREYANHNACSTDNPAENKASFIKLGSDAELATQRFNKTYNTDKKDLLLPHVCQSNDGFYLNTSDAVDAIDKRYLDRRSACNAIQRKAKMFTENLNQPCSGETTDQAIVHSDESVEADKDVLCEELIGCMIDLRARISHSSMQLHTILPQEISSLINRIVETKGPAKRIQASIQSKLASTDDMRDKVEDYDSLNFRNMDYRQLKETYLEMNVLYEEINARETQLTELRDQLLLSSTAVKPKI